MKNFMKNLADTLLLVVKGAVGFFAGAIGLLAGSARTTPADDELSSAIRGGVFNYRTGKLDDGTDPYGWYEDD
jgi:hypothetical protein